MSVSSLRGLGDLRVEQETLRAEILVQEPLITVDTLIRTAAVPSGDVRRRNRATILEVGLLALQRKPRFDPGLSDAPVDPQSGLQHRP